MKKIVPLLIVLTTMLACIMGCAKENNGALFPNKVQALLVADYNLFSIEQNNLYGFIDVNGNVVIKPQYDSVENFSDNLAVVSKNGRYGFIDSANKLVIPFVYKRAYDFHNGLASVVDKDNKVLLIDKKGQVIVRNLPEVVRFSEGLAYLKSGNNCGYVDKIGNWKINPIYSYCSDFSNGVAVVALKKNEENLFSIIDKNAKEIIKSQRNQILDYSNGTAVMYAQEHEKNGISLTCVYLDSKAKVFLDPIKLGYSSAIDDDGNCSNFSENLLLVAGKNGKWHYINKQGEIVISTIFKGWANGHDAPLSDFHEGFALFFVEKNHSYENGFIDMDGKKVFEELKIIRANDFKNGLAYVYTKGREGYINKVGRFVWSKERIKEKRYGK